METIIFLLNHMFTYSITADLGKIVLKGYIASVSSNYSIENPYYLHRTCIGKIKLTSDKGSNQGAQLVISAVPQSY